MGTKFTEIKENFCMSFIGRLILLGFVCIIAPLAYAQERVKTIDGREFILHSNGTFEEVSGPDPYSSKKYRNIGYIDLKVDIKNMIGERVRVKAFINPLTGIFEIHPPNELSHNALLGWDDGLSRSDRKFLIEECEGGCNVVILGRIGKNMGSSGLFVHDVIH